jgi:hypothetical protein
LSLGEHFHSAGFAPPRLVFNQDGWGWDWLVKSSIIR